MATLVKAKDCILSRLKSLTRIQRFNHTLQPKIRPETEMGSDKFTQKVNVSNWKKVDARRLGVYRSSIPEPSWKVLNVLKCRGYKVYLVGGCVRDLIMKKVPKDFDVVTTANLNEVQKNFRRSMILGKRFPICQVHVRGSIIEVSSFDTVANHVEGTEKILTSQVPYDCDKEDLVLWRNSMHRDFTINSLFFDPFSNKIYDYANGIADLRSSKLRTLIPADMSFKEDCARILRGLRIAARLGLSFSKDTETAIHKFSTSIEKLDQFRLMLEINYMLSYGAAEPSISLLHKFNLLEIFLPFHATYLNKQTSKEPAQNCKMLKKLLFNLDKLVSCDRPAHCTLWIGLLGFHHALVRNPQDALVIWVFASVLYHGKWKEGVEFARKHAKRKIKFIPEIAGCSKFISDEELGQKVTKLASLVQDSIFGLTETDSGFVVPKKFSWAVFEMLDVLVTDIKSYEKGRKSLLVDYKLLGTGSPNETRFALGEIILETLSGGLVPAKKKVDEEKNHHHLELMKENPVNDQSVVRNNRRHGQVTPVSEPKQEPNKKQKLVEKNCSSFKQEPALSEIILETFSGGLVPGKKKVDEEKYHHHLELMKENPVNDQSVVRKNRRHGQVTPVSEPKQEPTKKQKLVEKNCSSFKQEPALSEIILETLSGGLVPAKKKVDEEKNNHRLELMKENPVNDQSLVRKNRRHGRVTAVSESKQDPTKKQKLVEKNRSSFKQEPAMKYLMEIVNKEPQQIAKEHLKVVEAGQLPKGEKIATQGNILEVEDHHSSAEEAVSKKNDKHKKFVEASSSPKQLADLF